MYQQITPSERENKGQFGKEYLFEIELIHRSVSIRHFLQIDTSVYLIQLEKNSSYCNSYKYV